MPSTLNLRLQASTPSDHLCSAFLLPTPPQFLYQAPPGAQQLALPDFKNVPHFEHVIVLAIIEVLTDVVIGVRTISSRSGTDRRDTYSGTDRRVVMCRYARSGRVSQTTCEIDPGDPSNMSSLLAPEETQASPQSV